MHKITGQLSRCADRKSQIKMLLLVLLTLSAAKAWSLQTGDDSKPENARPLKVSGSVISVRLTAEDANAVKVRLSVSVVAQNAGQEGLILLKDTPASNAEYLFPSATAQQPLWMLTHPAAAERGPTDRSWQKLQTALDQKDPPDDLTITLNPGETIAWNIIVQLNIPKNTAGQTEGAPSGAPSGATWDVIRKASPCWLKLDLDFWPVNVEPKPDPDNPAFAKKLFKRWRKKGRLIFTEKQSEPIQVKLDIGS